MPDDPFKVPEIAQRDCFNANRGWCPGMAIPTGCFEYPGADTTRAERAQNNARKNPICLLNNSLVHTISSISTPRKAFVASSTCIPALAFWSEPVKQRVQRAIEGCSKEEWLFNDNLDSAGRERRAMAVNLRENMKVLVLVAAFCCLASTITPTAAQTTTAPAVTTTPTPACADGFGGPECDACSNSTFAVGCNVTCSRHGTCSGHGRCRGVGQCACSPGWQGADCSQAITTTPEPTTTPQPTTLPPTLPPTTLPPTTLPPTTAGPTACDNGFGGP
eukprot:2027810-Rhodomonas_salina.1